MNVSHFTADAARELGEGPDAERRAAAAEQLATIEAPSTSAEEWRYSRIDELDLDRYRPAPRPGGEATPLTVGHLPEGSLRIDTIDGWPQLAGLPTPGQGPAGVDIRVEPDAATHGGDLFDTLGSAFSGGTLVIEVARNTSVEAPIVIVHSLLGEGVAAFPQVLVRAGENSSVTVIEFLVSGAVTSFVSPLTRIDAAAAARVRHLTISDPAATVWQVAHWSTNVGQSASVDAAVAALGGDYARMRLDCRLEGRGAEARLAAAYLGTGSQMIDLRTFQEHVGPDTRSELLFKGAVGGEAHAVYTGLIGIRPGSRGAVAHQTNRVVKLSEHAWAESVPNLEIEHNDVRCSHASAVGPVDEDQRFYLESRGVPPTRARRLIVAGFFAEVLDRFGVPEVGAALAGRIAEGIESIEAGDV